MKLMWNSTSQMKIHSWSDHCWSTQSLTKQLWAITTYHYLLDGTEIRTYPCLSTSSPVLPEEGNAGLHLASAIYPLLDHWLPVQSTLLILVSHLWWMPAGQMFDSVPLCMCMCVCERLIKMSLDLAVTPSVGALIVWQSANNPLMLWERNRKEKKATGLRTSINEPPIQRLIVPPGTMIVLTHHPPPLWSWFPHFLCSVLWWVAAGNAVDKWSKKNRECVRDRWKGGCAA